ncbi:amidase [uncultured Chloroflexus sp.]|uniref:amidase n=1 Tax=uncultured Chloroflexus sp. TaxID=214040 RepID=UPI002622EAFB|nr:amidase [uncultured Chloroflexus sp.]
MPTDLCLQPATAIARLIRQRAISASEVLAAHLVRIEALNPLVNAIVTLDVEGARDRARAIDQALARGEDPGPLAGLPVAHKDLAETKGMRTTYGSPIFADFVPDFDALIVARLKAAGAVTIGKTNTPEFGAGSQTFNPIFGPTRNPYDLSKTCGGSSGGAAVALACGMIPIADGSDLGGSLRNPAGYCNVVGFRTSPGRVPVWPDPTPYLPFAIDGPMARTVADIALILQAIAGPDPRAPLSISEPASIFAQPLECDLRGVRVAWSPDLGGLPVDSRVSDVIAAQRAVFEQLGCIVEEATPDLSDADEIFQVMRAFRYELALGELLDRERARMKDTVVWNIEAGRALSGPQVGRAMRLHAALLARLHEFMQTYEFIIAPVSQVPPFPVDQPYITEINGIPMRNYIEWMRSCYYISVCNTPAIAVPAGFTHDGLPVGLQIIGRPRADVRVLQLAYAYEQATQHWRRHPQLATA